MKLTASVYGGGPFYPGPSSALPTLNQTNFTTVVCWAVHVHANGNLVYNDTPIVTNGVYIGDSTWGTELAKIKSGGSVNRILFSIGGWETQDFYHIMSLIQSEGTSPSSILYKNFQALLKEIPVIDGIDYDDEGNYDQNTIIQLSQMLSNIGYKEITFCPYTMSSFWINCLTAIEATHPGLVTGFNLQCYAGGSGNLNSVQQGWIDPLQKAMPSGFNAAAFIDPGLWCKNGSGCTQGMDASTIQSYFSGWKNDGITGGFIWLYDDIMKCGNDPQSYANAILKGLS
jgi:hypothetical protein